MYFLICLTVFLRGPTFKQHTGHSVTMVKFKIVPISNGQRACSQCTRRAALSYMEHEILVLDLADVYVLEKTCYFLRKLLPKYCVQRQRFKIVAYKYRRNVVTRSLRYL